MGSCLTIHHKLVDRLHEDLEALARLIVRKGEELRLLNDSPVSTIVAKVKVTCVDVGKTTRC